MFLLLVAIPRSPVGQLDAAIPRKSLGKKKFSGLEWLIVYKFNNFGLC